MNIFVYNSQNECVTLFSSFFFHLFIICIIICCSDTKYEWHKHLFKYTGMLYTLFNLGIPQGSKEKEELYYGFRKNQIFH